MRAGPKAAVTAPPLDLWLYEDLTRGERACEFIEEFLLVPKGTGALEPFRLRPWQRDIVLGVFAPGIRQGLVSVARGNGKSGLAAALAVYGLLGDEVEGAQVLTVASDERQARIVFNVARRMVELSPDLKEQVQIFQDKIYAPHTDSVLRPLPADAPSLQGWDPSLCIVDELHVVNEETYDAMIQASGKRDTSLLLAISTAAGDKEGVMWKLTEHGRAGNDPSFFFAEWAATPGSAIDDEKAWTAANPALDDFLSRDAIRASLRTTRETSFRRYRLNQHVAAEGAWLPWGIWDTLATDETLPDGVRVVLGFDGSASGDSTALVGCTVAEDPHVFVIDVWHNPGDPRWRVPRAEVDRAVDLAMERYDVVELAADPWGWRSEIEGWAARHGEERVIEWPTNVVKRMAPATDRIYQAIVTGRVSHDGDERLAAHMRNCVAETTAQGDLVRKDRKGSPRKIDAAVAAIVAFDRAAFHFTQRPRSRKVLTFR